MTSRPEPPRITPDLVVLIPVFNDWASIAMLLPSLDEALHQSGRRGDVLMIDDGSTIAPPAALGSIAFQAIDRLDVLRLRRNLGHQRAIAVGLAYVENTIEPAAVVVMDGDGEDDPRDVPRLLDRMNAENGQKIVFAERTRRSESLRFRIGYHLYRAMHRFLTGESVRVGNFSAIPPRRLSSLVVVSELWNHYAAAAFRSRQPFCTIPTRRARRLHGTSSMNYVALVTHGLSAISVFGDVVGVRLLVLAFSLAILASLGFLAAVAVRLTTTLAIPGWATFAAGLSLNLLIQSILLIFIFSFVTLASRQGSSFLPIRDYPYFIAECQPLRRPSAARHEA